MPRCDTGADGAWRSLVARVLWEHEVPGSNPAAPTTLWPMIAVTGATGGVGGRVARALAAQGLALRLVVRDAARAPGSGAEVADATYRDGAAMRAAFEGAETVFLVSASESADRVAEHFSAVDAAAAAGRARIVYMSFMGAAPDAVFTFARDHCRDGGADPLDRARPRFLRSCMYADYVPVFASPRA